MAVICRLAKIKAEAKRKREEREHDEMLRDMESKRRQTALLTQFSEWEDAKSTQGIEKRVNLALVSHFIVFHCFLAFLNSIIT